MVRRFSTLVGPRHLIPHAVLGVHQRHARRHRDCDQSAERRHVRQMGVHDVEVATRQQRAQSPRPAQVVVAACAQRVHPHAARLQLRDEGVLVFEHVRHLVVETRAIAVLCHRDDQALGSASVEAFDEDEDPEPSRRCGPVLGVGSAHMALRSAAGDITPRDTHRRRRR